MNKKEKHILIIAFAYPPNPIIGARRISKISKHLYNNGWIPHVITAVNNNYKNKVNIEIPLEFVYELKWNDIWIKLDKYGKGFIGAFLIKVIKTFFIPYASSRRLKPWRKVAESKALEIIKKHNIKLIYSTYSPKENIIIAHNIKSKTKTPWINEYRDLWTLNPYRKQNLFSKKINELYEKKLIKNVDALVTVSPPLKEDLLALHNKETYVIYNGYDKLDNTKKTKPNNIFNIIYTGAIYNGKRDPKVLFKALNLLKEENYTFFDKIKISFYGPSMLNVLGDMVKKYNLEESIFLSNSIPHNEAVEIQKNANLLLLLGWNNPKDKGVVTGKLFEYIGRKKSILAITYPNGTVRDILTETGLGKVLVDEKEIAVYLKNIVTQHLTNKTTNVDVNEKNIRIFSRENQVQKLITIFKKYLN